MRFAEPVVSRGSSRGKRPPGHQRVRGCLRRRRSSSALAARGGRRGLGREGRWPHRGPRRAAPPSVRRGGASPRPAAGARRSRWNHASRRRVRVPLGVGQPRRPRWRGPGQWLEREPRRRQPGRGHPRTPPPPRASCRDAAARGPAPGSSSSPAGAMRALEPRGARSSSSTQPSARCSSAKLGPRVFQRRVFGR